jgi:hypothetical protein
MSGEHEASGPQASRPGSTVLARMIQRTREPRPSLEPVIPPLFATRADRFVPGEDPASDTPSPDLLPSDGPPPDVLALAAFSPDARLPHARPPEARQPEALAPEAPSPDVPFPEAPDAALSTPGRRHYRPDRRARASDGGASAPAAQEFPSSAGASGPATEAFAAGLVAQDDLGSANAPALLAPVPPFRREYLSEQRSYRSAAPAAEVPADQERAPGPSVTITIGHIEVRAPSAPPRPPRPEPPPRPKPAFRPQTTLADFLDEGTIRPGRSGRR